MQVAERSEERRREASVVAAARRNKVLILLLLDTPNSTYEINKAGRRVKESGEKWREKGESRRPATQPLSHIPNTIINTAYLHHDTMTKIMWIEGKTKLPSSSTVASLLAVKH